MLKNAQIIHRMSVDERIRFLVNQTAEQSKSIGDYKFPIIALKENPIGKNPGDTVTIFPSNHALAHSWNRDIVREISEKRGVESNLMTEYTLYKQEGNVFGKQSISEDPFLYGEMLKAQTEGLKEVESFVSLDLYTEENNTVVKHEISLLPLQMAVKANKYDVVLVDSVDELRNWRKEYAVNCLVFARAHSELDIIRFLNEGATLIAYDGDYEHAVEYIKEALRRYKNEKAKLDNGMIFNNEYQEMLTDGKILSLENLNLACERLIDLMQRLNEKYQNDNNDVSKKYVRAYRNGETYVEGHEETAYLGASESIVLLKNNAVLPIKNDIKCAFIGDAFVNASYYKDNYENIPSKFKSPYDLAGEYYEIDCEGFASGYLKDGELNEKLIEKAVELANKVPVTIVYLHGNGEEYLPQEQLEVLNRIAKTETKIVAVVISETMVDLSFVDLCDALIYAGELGQEGPKAILDVITGIVNPSGKLTHSYPILVADEHATNGLPMYMADEHILFPFGYGLSYTTFEYHHLEIKENGISFSVTNTGELAGSEIVQFYVQKAGTNSTLRRRNLKGFAKVRLEKGDTAKVYIPFDENTFRYYDEAKKGYGVEGGEYKILLADNAATVKLEGVANLHPYIDSKVAYENEKEKLLSEKEVKAFIYEEPSVKPYKKRLVLTILLAIYINLFGILLILLNTANSGNALGSIILAILIVVADILMFVKTRKARREYLKQKAEYVNNNDENETLTLMLEKMKNIRADEKIVYEIEELVPVETNENLEEIKQLEELPEIESEEVEEVEEEEEKVEETVEEVVEEIVDLENTVLSMEEIAQHEEEEIRRMEEQQAGLNGEEGFQTYEKVVEFDTESSLNQAVSNFIAYAEYKGLTIDINSARSLLSALGAAHILILNTKIKELMPTFIEVLNDYLGNSSHIVDASDNWISSFNLTWKKEEDGTYSKTDFVNDVYNANRLKNNINVAILNNVNMKNVNNYLQEFIDFANYPSYPHSMRLNQKLFLKIPTNFKIVLIPQSDDYVNSLPEDLASASICVELLMRKHVDPIVEEVKPNCLSYNYFEDLIYEAKKVDFLEEDSWKKLDDLLNEINCAKLVTLNNKVMLQIERYTSVYINAGGDEVDAFDSIFAEKIVPLLKTVPTYRTYEGIKTLLSLIEKHFGHDNTSRTSRALSSANNE